MDGSKSVRKQPNEMSVSMADELKSAEELISFLE
jgi:hypothetical protein